MKIKKMTACIGTVLLLTVMTGCSNSSAPSSNPSSAEENTKRQETEKDNPAPDEPSDISQKEIKDLSGSVKTIGTDSITISQSFNEGDDIIVQPAEGSPEEVCTDVFVSETTEYEVHTVKNSGVNGDSDVETQKGDFSDLAEDVSVDISGYEEDGRFWAEKIVIYQFV